MDTWRTRWGLGCVVLVVALMPTICPADYYVRLRCDGRRVINNDGQEIALRGIYTRGAWMTEGGGEQDIIRLKSWGCDFLRVTIPFDSDYWNTVNGGVFDISKRGILREQDLLAMDDIAAWCENHQMYFMLCQQPTYQGFDFNLLAHAPTDPDLYAQQMAAVATTLAQRYGSYDYLMGYEPFGEPHGIDTYAERVAYRQICTAYVDAIRAVDPERIVSIAACSSYAHPGSFVDDMRVDRDNLIYTFSYYTCRPFVSYQSWYGDMRYPGWTPDFYQGRVIWLDSDWLWSYGLDDAVSASSRWNVPVYCHEFGAWGNGQWDGSSPDDSSQRYMRDMVQHFENNTVGWIIWRWQQNAIDVPDWWKGLWQRQENNRVVIEPHGGTFVDSVQVSIHTFVPGADVYYTTDGTVPDETSSLYTGPFTITTAQTIKARAIKSGLESTPVDAAVFTEGGHVSVSVSNPASGLRYWVYQGSWNGVPDFGSLAATSYGTCSGPSSSVGGAGDNKAVLWKGYLNITEPAVYYFNARVDSAAGMEMHIAGSRVILDGYEAGSSYSVGQIALEAGLHPFEMGYSRPSGAGSWFEIQIQRPGDSVFVSLPSNMLFYDDALPGAASNPEPLDDATDVPINRDLRWSGSGDAFSYDVYFGKTNPPPLAANPTGEFFDAGIMDPHTVYYWRVDERNEHGVTTGDLWQFTTGSERYLIAWWPFDEGQGATAEDVSGTGNHAQLYNIEAGDWPAGRHGSALSLDGVDDYGWVVHDPSLDLGTGDFSMSLWIRKQALDGTNRYLYNQRVDGYNWFYLLWKSYNVIEAKAKIGGPERIAVRSASTLAAATWYHVVLVVDRDSYSHTRIYINGVNDTASVGVLSAVDCSLGAGASIGRWSGGNSENWDGLIDDFRFFSWALSEAEVDALHAYGFGPADLDRNEKVNAADFARLAAVWSNEDCGEPGWCYHADVNQDGVVDVSDLGLFAQYWLNP